MISSVVAGAGGVAAARILPGWLATTLGAVSAFVMFGAFSPATRIAAAGVVAGVVSRNWGPFAIATSNPQVSNTPGEIPADTVESRAAEASKDLGCAMCAAAPLLADTFTEEELVSASATMFNV